VFIATMLVTVSAGAQTKPNYGPVTLSAGPGPVAARIGDLNGDAKNDIAVVTLGGSLHLFHGDGAGSFQKVSLNGLWPAGTQAANLAIGDLNGDGKNDIAVALAASAGTVSVLLNTGAGFAAPVNHNVCGATNSVAIGDLNRDNDNDLAITGGCSQAVTLANNGSGTFTPSGTFASGNSPRSISLADFNNDGYLDIAVLNATGQGVVRVLFNQRDGTFGSSIGLYAGDLPSDFASGDFDGDGSKDLAIANPYFSQVIVLFNDNVGTFLTGYSELSAGDTPDSIAVGDFNGDGRTDIAAGSRNNNAVAVLLNTGSYNFANPFFYTVGQTPVATTVGALDGDNRSDIVTVNQAAGTVTALLSSIAPTPPPPPPPPPPIVLSASTRLTFSGRFVDLRWTGASNVLVNVFRNNSRIATVSNGGSYSDRFSRSAHGTFTYKVCNGSTGACSNQVTVTF
jgi:hypothetical protein